MNNPQQPSPPGKNWLVYSGMAFEMFGIIGLFAGAGYLLDKFLHTSPIFLLILLMLGLAGALYRIYQQFTQS